MSQSCQRQWHSLLLHAEGHLLPEAAKSKVTSIGATTSTCRLILPNNIVHAMNTGGAVQHEHSSSPVRPAMSHCGNRALHCVLLLHNTLMRMPKLAATPVPTITAVGVARPSAHGHAMTKTVAPKSRAKRPALLPSGIHCAGTAPERAARQLDSIYKKVCILQSIEARQSTSIVSDMRPIGQHAKFTGVPARNHASHTCAGEFGFTAAETSDSKVANQVNELKKAQTVALSIAFPQQIIRSMQR